MVSVIQSVGVFCGSSSNVDGDYLALASELGRALADQRIGIVYGGGDSGLMGAVAGAAMKAGGEVTGVLPAGLFTNGIDGEKITNLELVGDMHQRKFRMYELADAFIGLPGGLGTFEEVFEAATWSQLGLHAGGRRKPVVLLDRNGYWKPVHDLLDRATADHFMGVDTRALVRDAHSVAAALAAVHA